MASLELNINQFNNTEPIPVLIITFGRKFYNSLKETLSRLLKTYLIIVGVPILLLLSPIWVSALYLVLRRSIRRYTKLFEEIKIRYESADRSEEMFDFYESAHRFKDVFEQNGEFHLPKHKYVFRPFFNQFRRFYNLAKEQALWLEAKLYPTSEELGLPEEAIQKLYAQLSEDDIKELKSIDWVEDEKDVILGLN